MQERFLNYKEDDSTFLINSRLVGLIEPGCYRGWDLITRRTDLTLVLEHTRTGSQRVDSTATVGAWRGIVITKQGTIITEDAAMTYQIAPGDMLPRIDMLVCKHTHVAISGGKTAVYTVLKGVPSATPVAPSLDAPGSQTIVGYLYLPANASSINAEGVKWTPNRPEFANKAPYVLPASVAHWNKRQDWSERQLFSGIALAFTENIVREDAVLRITSADGIVFNVPGTGDITRLMVPESRRGEVFLLRFNAPGRLVAGAAQVNGSLDMSSVNQIVTAGDVVSFLIAGDGSAILLQVSHVDAARLEQINRFTKTQQFAKGSCVFQSFGETPGIPGQAAGITLRGDGNSFEAVIPSGLQARVAYLSSMPEGTEISLVVTTSGRPSGMSVSSDAYDLPDWCLEDPGWSGLAGAEGYQPIRIMASPVSSVVTTSSRLVPAYQQGGVFKFLSFGGSWILISSTDFSPGYQHDRRLLTVDPISGGNGYQLVPSTGALTSTGALASQVLHEVTVPTGQRRDYLFHHSMSVAKISTKPTLNVAFYRQNVRLRSFQFVVIDINSHPQIITTSYLFVGCQPGEVLQLRIDRGDQTTNQIALYNSTLSIDGTPSTIS